MSWIRIGNGLEWNVSTIHREEGRFREGVAVGLIGYSGFEEAESVSGAVSM